MLSIEGRCVIGPENTLFAGASGDFTGWSNEGVNVSTCGYRMHLYCKSETTQVCILKCSREQASFQL